jgi:hypothetical protein
MPGTIALFGELHGTREIPQMVGDVACRALAGGARVLLGVELSTELTPKLDAFIHSSGDRAATDRLLADTIWHRSYQDGRPSHASLARFERARELAAEGRDIRIVAFSVEASTGLMRDSLMAVQLARAVASRPSEIAIVLTGNIHSRTTVGTPFDPSYRPMGLILGRLAGERRVIGLNVSYTEGSAWICSTSSPASCGPRPTRGRPTADSGVIVLRDSVDRDGYTGYFGVGTLSPSPPAISAR